MEENITFIAKFLLLLSPFYIEEAVTQGLHVNKRKISLQQYVTLGKYHYYLMGRKNSKDFLVVHLTESVQIFQLNSLNAVVSVNGSSLNISFGNHIGS